MNGLEFVLSGVLNYKLQKTAWCAAHPPKSSKVAPKAFQLSERYTCLGYFKHAHLIPIVGVRKERRTSIGP